MRNFKEWFFVEMGRARVPEGQSFEIPSLPDEKGRTKPITVTSSDIIDMRFEDYGVKLGDFSPWQVKLPDGRYLINHGMYNYEISQEPGKYQEVPTQAISKDDGKSHPWYDFAEVISDNDEVKKAPLHQSR